MHFFTEPSKLNAQTAANAFGPDASDPDNKYNISSRHTVSAAAKIFACQDAMMLVRPQTGSTTLVNIILKPISNLEIPFTNVKYYIYRGVDRTSLVVNVTPDVDHPDGIAITPSTGTPTQFISKFWKRWNDFKNNTNQTALSDPLPNSFGYDPATAGTTPVEELFNSAASTNATINDFQAIRVSEGEWIANLQPSVDFEFEIITDTDHLTVDLAYVQKDKQIIDATGLQSYLQPVDLNAIAKRELILNYVDPAAFFGMHYYIGIKVFSSYNTTTFETITDLKKERNVLTNVINNFSNKNVVYLDVRSEKGYSYFYYKNYHVDAYSGSLLQWSEALKLKSESQATFHFLDYAALYWPLINLQNPSFSINPVVEGERLELKLLILDNKKPLLFLENPSLLGATNKDHFLDEKKLIDTANVLSDYTLPILIYPPYTTIGSNKKNFAYHIRLQYFRTDYSVTLPNTILKKSKFPDDCFGGINIPDLNVATPFNHVQKTKLTYVKGATFSYVAKSGVYKDNTRLLFYGESYIKQKSSSDVYPIFDVTTTPPADVDVILKNKNVVFNKFQINDGSANIDMLTIVGYNRTSLQTTPTEDLVFLGLLKTEVDDLNSLSGISALHQKYFVLTELFDGAPGKFFKDTITSKDYRKFRVDIQGIDETTKESKVIDSSSLANDVIVYGLNEYMLCSPGFSAAINLPYSLPDPGVIGDDLVGKFDYNETDSDVQSLFSAPIAGHLMNAPDNGNNQGLPTINAKMKARVFFPSSIAGSSSPSDIVRKSPLILIIHGNGQYFHQYDEVGNHLARNGFIVASISCLMSILDPFTLSVLGTTVTDGPITYDRTFFAGETLIYSTTSKVIAKYSVVFGVPTVTPLPFYVENTHFTVSGSTISFLNPAEQHGMASLGRANVAFAHLIVLKQKFGSNLNNEIGLMGHSRGGEAVLRVAKDIAASSAPSTLKNIKAIISLAPTDQYDEENLTQAIPYYVLYGSMDGDVHGAVDDLTVSTSNRTSGFSLYDRAINTTEKSMSFVYGATHNGFITNNGDYNTTAYSKYAGNLIDLSVQKSITKAFMNAFFRCYVKDENLWKPILQGTYIPPSIQYKRIQNQFKNMKNTDVLAINNFQTGSNIGASVGKVRLESSLGTNLNAKLTEGKLISTDKQTPYETKGLIVEWSALNKLIFNISSSGSDVHALQCLSFRIGQVAEFNSPLPPANLVDTKPVTSGMYHSGTKAYLGNDIVNLELMKLCDGLPYSINSLTDISDMKITLKDTLGNEHELSLINTLLAPHVRENKLMTRYPKNVLVDNKGTPTDASDDEITFAFRNPSKSSMQTMRIPLSEFGSNGVDLTKVKELSIIFPSAGNGKMVFDDFEFSN